MPTEAPIASKLALPIGFTAVANHLSDAAILTDPYFVALLPPSGEPIPVHGYWGYGKDAQNDATLKVMHAYHQMGYYTSLNIHVTSDSLVSSDGAVPIVGATPAQYTAAVQQIMTEHGVDLDAVEISNEGNVPSPGTSDGLSPYVIPDIVQGVIAAKQAVMAQMLSTRVGFNYVFSYHSPTDDLFFAELKAAIAQAPDFLQAVDYMGLHTYPQFLSGAPFGVDNGPNGPAITDSSGYPAIELDALHTGRCYMDYLGLARTVPISVTEVGNTGDADYINLVLPQIYNYRANYGIENLYYFTYEMLFGPDGRPGAGYDAIVKLQRQWNS